MACFLNKVSSPRLQIASTLQFTHTWVLPYYITCARLFKPYYKYPELGSNQPKTQQELSGTVGTRQYRQEYLDLRIRDRMFNCTVNKHLQYAGKTIYTSSLRGSLTNLKDVGHQKIGRDDAATDGGSAPTDWDTPEGDARAAGGAAGGRYRHKGRATSSRWRPWSRDWQPLLTALRGHTRRQASPPLLRSTPVLNCEQTTGPGSRPLLELTLFLRGGWHKSSWRTRRPPSTSCSAPWLANKLHQKISMISPWQRFASSWKNSSTPGDLLWGSASSFGLTWSASQLRLYMSWQLAYARTPQPAI